MIELILLGVIVYVVAVVQTVFAVEMAIGPVGPDLLAVTAIVWVVCRGRGGAVYVASAIGLAADLVSPGRVGAGAAAFALTAYFVMWLKSRLPVEDCLSRTAVVWIFTTLITVLLTAAAVTAGEFSGAWSGLPLHCLGVGVYSAAIALPVFIALGPWRRAESRLSPGG